MLHTSQDLFFIIVTICILFFTMFACWAIYYFVRILKDIHELVHDFKTKIDEIHASIFAIKEKLENSLSSVGMVTKAVKGIMSMVERKKAKKEYEDE